MGNSLRFCGSPLLFLSFNKPMVSGITMSGHKFLGTSIICGVLMVRKSLLDNVVNAPVEYVGGVLDTTLTGSRSGHAAIFLWAALLSKGDTGLRREVEHCIAVADHLKDRLIEANVDNVAVAPFSTTVVFAKPEVAPQMPVPVSPSLLLP